MEAMGNEGEMSKYLNKILKNKAKKDIGTLKKAMGNIQHLEELAQKHYPTHTGKKETVYPNVFITKQELLTRYNDWINEEKIIAAFKGFESKKSPGPDGLKHLPQSMITSIKMIYKASIALHFTPTKWKTSKVV